MLRRTRTCLPQAPSHRTTTKYGSMSHRNYAHPPITEAIIDLQVRGVRSDVSQSEAEALLAQTKDAFTSLTPLNQFQIGWDATTGASTHQQAMTGWRYAGANSVLQVQQRGFTFSRLPPYTTWEAFQSEARKYWELASKLLSPEAVTRYAVRFVNRIVVPEVGIELSDYFALYPTIPPKIPQSVTGMFSQLQMPQADLGAAAFAVINMAMVPPDRPNTLAIVLDVDLSCAQEIEPQSDKIWDLLERFRTRKNEIFEACITDKTRELFK